MDFDTIKVIFAFAASVVFILEAASRLVKWVITQRRSEPSARAHRLDPEAFVRVQRQDLAVRQKGYEELKLIAFGLTLGVLLVWVARR